MPYQKPSVLTERVGLPGTPLGNTNFFIPVVIAKTLGSLNQMSRTAEVSGDTENIYVNGQMVKAGDTLNYERVTYNTSTKQTSMLQRLPLQSVLSVSMDKNNPYARQFVEGVDFTVNKALGILDFSAAPVIPVPEIDNVTTAASGGLITAATYDIAVMSKDVNSVAGTPSTLSTASSRQIITTGSTSTITVQWGKIVTAAGYVVYAKKSTDSAAQYSMVADITSGTTTSVVLTAAINASPGALSLPVANGTKHTPSGSVGQYVYINYLYKMFNYNSPKRYFDTETLQSDHGIGSEIANAGRLVMGPAGTGAGAGSMYIVAPEISTGEIVGYQNAIDACESIQELVLMSTSSSSDTVNTSLVAHCQTMSAVENAKERFALVSTTSAIMADTDVSKVTNKILALNGSNRAVFVVTDGGHPMVNQWQNTESMLNVITGQTESTSYTSNQAVDGPWHAIALTGMIAALPDPATPPTNKQVYGINSGVPGTVRLWTDTRKDAIAAVGGCVLEDRFNNMFVRHALTVSQASVEDSEISIVLAEAYMAKRLRDTHLQFIGQKLTASLLTGVTNTTSKTLDGLVKDVIITSYTNLTVYQDTLKPTWVYVKFEYKPIYPTNVVKFEWGFDLASA